MSEEENDQPSPQLMAAWPSVGESAEVLASKVQQLLSRLAAVEPAYGEAEMDLTDWEDFHPDLMPEIVSSDCVARMSEQEFAALIDREGRFDKPLSPGDPVSADGYSFFIDGEHSAKHPRGVGMAVRAGQRRPGAWDTVTLHLESTSPVWRDADLSRSIFDILIDVTGCQAASVYRFIADRVSNEENRSYHSPWMTWVAHEASHPLPHPFPFPRAQPAAERRSHRHGELAVWRDFASGTADHGTGFGGHERAEPS